MNEHEALRERHNRLRLAAQAITTDAREGDADHSLVPTHLVRLLERELRAAALRLAGEDAAAYRAVIDASRERRSEALAAAADPPLAIAEAAAETGALAAASAGDAGGPLRCEADRCARGRGRGRGGAPPRRAQPRGCAGRPEAQLRARARRAGRGAEATREIKPGSFRRYPALNRAASSEPRVASPAL